MWLLVSCTLGWTLALISVCFLLAIPYRLVQPLLMGVTDEACDTDDGIFHAESVADGVVQYVLVVPAFLLWWYVAPVLVRLVARIDRDDPTRVRRPSSSAEVDDRHGGPVE